MSASWTRASLGINLVGTILLALAFSAASSARSFVVNARGETIATCEGDNLVFTGGGLDWSPPSPRPPNGPDGVIRCPYGERHAIATVSFERPALFWIGSIFIVGSLGAQVFLVPDDPVKKPTPPGPNARCEVCGRPPPSRRRRARRWHAWKGPARAPPRSRGG